MGWGNSYPFALEIMEGGLDYGKWKCADYYLLGSAGALRRFFSVSSLISYNL